MKILISGSNGLLGCNLKNYFNSKKIIFSTIGKKKCNFEGDISNNKFVEQSIKKFTPNIFINLAAITNVDYCELHEDEAYKINTEFPEVASRILKHSDCLGKAPRHAPYTASTHHLQLYPGGGESVSGFGG